MWFGILGIHVSGLGIKEGNLTPVDQWNFLRNKLTHYLEDALFFATIEPVWKQYD
jgi:hypothetical protein